jgi:hypothetical protein
MKNRQVLLETAARVRTQPATTPATPPASAPAAPAAPAAGGVPNSNPTYLMPTDPTASPYGAFLNPANQANPTNVNAQFQSFQGTTQSAVVPQTTGAAGVPTSFVEISNQPDQKGTNSYLLPTDPNSAPYGAFMNPANNVNPLNVNAQFQQQAQGGAGAGGAAGGPQGGPQGAGSVGGASQPGVGAGVGNNPPTNFPQ